MASIRRYVRPEQLRELSLVFLRNQSVGDTLDILSAELRGDTLVGKFSKGARAKYIRR